MRGLQAPSPARVGPGQLRLLLGVQDAQGHGGLVEARDGVELTVEEPPLRGAADEVQAREEPEALAVHLVGLVDPDPVGAARVGRLVQLRVEAFAVAVGDHQVPEGVAGSRREARPDFGQARRHGSVDHPRVQVEEGPVVAPAVRREVHAAEAAEPLEHGGVLHVGHHALLAPPVVGRAELGPEVAQDDEFCAAEDPPQHGRPDDDWDLRGLVHDDPAAEGRELVQAVVQRPVAGALHADVLSGHVRVGRREDPLAPVQKAPRHGLGGDGLPRATNLFKQWSNIYQRPMQI